MRTEDQIIKEITDIVEAGDSSTCMCGDLIKLHGFNGHAPLSVQDYMLNVLNTELDAVRTLNAEQ